GVVRHPKYCFEQEHNSLRSPAIILKAEGCRSLRDQSRDLSDLYVCKCRPASRRRATAQCLDTATFAAAFQPLTYRALSDAQCFGDSSLGPPLLVQLPGDETTGFSQVIRWSRLHRRYQTIPSRH